jgi:hypothetical protein
MARQQREADVAEHDFVVEGERDSLEDNRRALSGCAPFEDRRITNCNGCHQYNSVIINRVTKKSTAITATDAATTALVVERPTPWVPPEVRRPT